MPFSQFAAKDGICFITQVQSFVAHSENQEFLEQEFYNLAARHISYITEEQGTKYLEMFCDCIIGLCVTLLKKNGTTRRGIRWIYF